MKVHFTTKFFFTRGYFCSLCYKENKKNTKFFILYFYIFVFVQTFFKNTWEKCSAPGDSYKTELFYFTKQRHFSINCSAPNSIKCRTHAFEFDVGKHQNKKIPMIQPTFSLDQYVSLGRFKNREASCSGPIVFFHLTRARNMPTFLWSCRRDRKSIGNLKKLY